MWFFSFALPFYPSDILALQQTRVVEHLDDFGDDGELFWGHFDPDIEGFDEFCAHLFSGSG